MAMFTLTPQTLNAGEYLRGPLTPCRATSAPRSFIFAGSLSSLMWTAQARVVSLPLSPNTVLSLDTYSYELQGFSQGRSAGLASEETEAPRGHAVNRGGPRTQPHGITTLSPILLPRE